MSVSAKAELSAKLVARSRGGVKAEFLGIFFPNCEFILFSITH
ncbi:hypothetical protein [Campylobacter iguaniorum]|nr:hypothetical protein [Campylobacter iguaniorum]